MKTKIRYRPRCPECQGLNVQTIEWVRWTDDGPEVVSGDGPGLDDWCDDCDAEISAEWVDA